MTSMQPMLRLTVEPFAIIDDTSYRAALLAKTWKSYVSAISSLDGVTIRAGQAFILSLPNSLLASIISMGKRRNRQVLKRSSRCWRCFDIRIEA